MGLTEQERMKRNPEQKLSLEWKPNDSVEKALRSGVESSQNLLQAYLERKTQYERRNQ